MESVIEELPEAAPAVDHTNEPTGTRVDVIKVDHRGWAPASCTRSRCRSLPVSWSPWPAAAARARRRCSRSWPGSAGRSTAPCCTTACRPVRPERPPRSATCPRTTSSTASCRWGGRCASPPRSGCRPGPRRATRSRRPSTRRLRDLDLTDRADVAVGALSGGQRKRASTAVELLARPRLLLLDEPTSGLDPATAAEVLAVLRRLAGAGRHRRAHHPRPGRHRGLRPCRVPGPRGPPGLRRYADGGRGLLRRPGPRPRSTAVSPTRRRRRRGRRRFAARRRLRARCLRPAPPSRRPSPIGAVRQWALLTRRTAEVMARNRLTLAVLLGSPFLVTAMMAVLFQPGAVDAPDPGSVGPVQTVFWIAFAGFFFGLDLRPAPDRRGAGRSSGENASPACGIGAYVLSKVAVLAPLLALLSAALLGVLRAARPAARRRAGTPTRRCSSRSSSSRWPPWRSACWPRPRWPTPPRPPWPCRCSASPRCSSPAPWCPSGRCPTRVAASAC